MDDIIELILEILAGVAEGVLGSDKVPRRVRVLVYLICAAALSALMFGIAYIIYEPSSAFRAVLATVLVLGTIAFDIWGFIAVWNGPKNKDDEE